MAEATLILYQTEWCPFSSAVREVLTELGLDFVARQVQPWPKDRADLNAVAGTDLIPVLEVEDGRQFRGTREIFAHLREREPSKYATANAGGSPLIATRENPMSPHSCLRSSTEPMSCRRLMGLSPRRRS